MNATARPRRSCSARAAIRCVGAGLAALLLFVPSARAQLAGSYTIGGTAPDFASFGAATAALTSQGVAGAVEFRVRAGTYTEAGGTAPVISLGAVAGTSAANRVTFRPDTASGATVDDVLLERSDVPPSEFTGYLVDLRADYVTLRDLTLRSGDTSSTAFTHGSFVNIQASSGERRGVEIVGCVLESRSLARTGVIATNGTSATFRDLRIAGNRFHDFVQGVALGGFASTYSDVTIENNVFTAPRYGTTPQGDPLGKAIDAGISGLRAVVRGNVFDYGGGSGQNAIVLRGTSTDFVIEGNEIENVFAGGLYDGFNGIQVVGASSRGRIVNNMVSVHTARRTGIYLQASGGVLVAHNTVYLPSRGIDFFGGSQALLLCASNVDVFDNILVDLGTGTNNRTNAILQANCNNTDNEFDGNLLYNANGALAFAADGSPVADLAAWQAIGNGANSVSKLPEVVNVHDDLHLAGCTAGDPDLYGLPVAAVNRDIDGRLRTVSGPMMGAHEARADFPSLFGEAALYEPMPGNLNAALYLDAADLDDDDDVDLVVSVIGNLADKSIALLANQGDGTFVPLPPIPIVNQGDPTIVQAADIDADGAVDIAVALDGATVFRVYWGAGDGSFPTLSTYSINQPFTLRERLGISDFELVDLDGDGYLDMVFTDVGIPSVSGEPGDVGVLCNADGNSFFDSGPSLAGPLNPYDLVVADMDGDLDPDVLVNSANGTTLGEFGVFANGGGACPALGFYKYENHYATVESAPLLPDMAAADLDGDGLADIVFDDRFAPGPGNQKLPIYFNQGLLEFAVEETLVDTEPRRAPGPIAPMDYEGDGDVDLLVGNETLDLEGEGQLVLLENDGTGGFEPTLVCGPSKLPREPRMLVSDDFDGDGRPDFAAVLQGTREVAVVLQAAPEPGATGTFAIAVATLAALARRRRSGATRGGASAPTRSRIARFASTRPASDTSCSIPLSRRARRVVKFGAAADVEGKLATKPSSCIRRDVLRRAPGSAHCLESGAAVVP